MVRINTKRKSDSLMNKVKIFTLLIFSILFLEKVIAQEETVYDKIDLFGEVLEKINKEYVEEVDQSETMDAAINGVLQSLDPYSSYLSPKNLEEVSLRKVAVTKYLLAKL